MVRTAVKGTSRVPAPLPGGGSGANGSTQSHITDCFETVTAEEYEKETLANFTRYRLAGNEDDNECEGARMCETALRSQEGTVERQDSSERREYRDGRGRRSRSTRRPPPTQEVRCMTMLTQNVRGMNKEGSTIADWLAASRTRHRHRQVDAVLLQEMRAQGEWAEQLEHRHARAWGFEPTRASERLSFWQQASGPREGGHPLVPGLSYHRSRSPLAGCMDRSLYGDSRHIRWTADNPDQHLRCSRPTRT
jgi:hypothetical protein